jgi:hypothetical protein
LRDEYALFRLALPGVEERAVVALARGDPRVAALARGGAAAAPAPAGGEIARAVARARGLQRWVEGPDGFLLVFAEPGGGAEWLRLLPFVVGTSGLVVVPERDRSRVLAAVAAAPVLERGEGEGLEVRRIVHLGRRVAVALPER